MYEDKKLEEEAELFLGRNTQLSTLPFDKFLISVTAKRPIPTHIDSIVRELGLSVSNSGAGAGRVTAVKSMERVYCGEKIGGTKEGAVALRDSLRIIIDAWGKDSFPLISVARLLKALA